MCRNVALKVLTFQLLLKCPRLWLFLGIILCIYFFFSSPEIEIRLKTCNKPKNVGEK